MPSREFRSRPTNISVDRTPVRLNEVKASVRKACILSRRARVFDTYDDCATGVSLLGNASKVAREGFSCAIL